MDRRTRRQWRQAQRWLIRARRAAWAFRGWPDFRGPPAVDVERPDQPSVARKGEAAGLAIEYPLVEAADVLGLITSWSHRTVTAAYRPGREDFPWTMKLPKMCMGLALISPLDDHGEAWASVEALEAAYGPLGVPAVKAAWDADADGTFGDLRVAGPNPMFLRRYDDPAALRAEGLARDMPAGVYAVAYDRLFTGIGPASVTERRYFSPAIAVFTERDGRLRPLGVQLRGSDGAPRWFEPDGSPAWRLARRYFHCCDFLAHELIAHFLWTHVVGEKFLLATARNLTWRHPVRRLLAPHLANSLNNNNDATPVLIQRGGLFDTVFGAGERGKLAGLSRGEELWTFDMMVPERHLQARGLMDLAYHPYRDAALTLWSDIAEMVREYVALWYPTDLHVRRDEELERWSAELRAFAGPTVPPAEDRASLSLLLCAAIFNVLQHAFVNLLQFDALGYPPAYPVTMRVPVPDDPAAVTEQTLVDALPSVRDTLITIRATYGFSMQYAELGRNLARYHRGPSRAIIERFRARMKARHASAPEGYLPADPARVGNSVDA